MRKAVFKYPLSVADSQEIQMPEGAEILSVQVQGGVVCLWALVDMDAKETTRRFELYGTGHDFRPGEQKFIGTIQLYAGSIVFHVFEHLGFCGA